jgi:hypothetical protein
MRCDTCKHWNAKSDQQEWEAAGAGFGQCLGVRERWEIMDDASKKWADNDAEQDRADQTRVAALKAARAYVQDGSEYHAEMFTAPDFFCALYTPL